MKFFGLLHEKKYRSALDKVSVYWRRSQKGKEFAVSGHFFRSETRTDAGIEQVHSFGLFNSARVRIAVILSALSILFLLFYFARSTLAAYPVSVSGTAYSNEGTIPQTSTAVALFINGINKQSATTDGSTGAFTFSDLTLNANDILTVFFDTNGATTNGVTVTKATGANLTGINLYKDRLITRCDNTCSLTNADLKTGSGADTDVGNIYSVAEGNLIIPIGKNLIVGRDTFTPGGNVSVGSGVTINGTFVMGSNTLTLSGSWLNKGTFTKNTSTVVLNGGNQSMSGSTIFHNFRKIVTSASTLLLDGMSTQTISGSLTLRGTANQLLKIRATNSGASLSGAPEQPLKTKIGTYLTSCVAWDYNMGYKFTANANGSVTQLGLRVGDATARTVYLYNFATTALLASATVTGVNNTTWVYANITPVSLVSGQTYVVSVRGSGGSQLNCYYSVSSPFTQGNISVLTSIYYPSSNAMPTFTDTSNMYGFADITFVPGGGGGGRGAKLILDGDSGTQTIDYVDVKDNDATGGKRLIDFPGGVDSGNATNWFFGNSITGTVYSNEGTTTITSGTVALSINGGTKTTTTLNASGQYTFTGLSFSGDSILTLYIDDATPKGVTVTRGSGGSLTGINLYQNRLILRSNTGSTSNAPALTNTHLDLADDNGDTDITDTFSVTGGNLVMPSGKKLLIWSGSKYTPGGNVSVGSGITIAGIFEPGSNTITLSGSWINKGTFTKATSSVILDGGDQTLSGSTLFQNLQKIVISPQTLTLYGPGIQSVSGSLTLQGSEGNLLKLRASSSGAVAVAGTPVNPLQAKIGSTTTTCSSSNYNMGYRFTANANGMVTQLGVRVNNTESRTVRLYNFTTGTVLASATVSGVDSTTWVYVNITPVALTSGTTYIVSERGTTYCYVNVAYPFTQSDITVLDARYISNSDAMPNSTDSNYNYGFADLTFVPGGLGGDSNSGSKLNLGAAGSQTIQFVDVKDNNAKWGQALSVTAGGVDSGNNTNWTFSTSLPYLSGTAYSDEGTTPQTSTAVALFINGANKQTTTTNVANGSFSFTNLTLSANDILTVYYDTNGSTTNGVTMTKATGGSLTNINLYKNRLITRCDNSCSLTNANLKTGSGADSDVGNIYSVAGGNLILPLGKKLIVGSNTFAPGGNVSVGSGITIAGTFEPGSNTITLSGSWINKGTFTKATSSVILDGGDQTLSGSTLFQNLQKIVISPQTLTLYGPGIQSVSGSLTLQGSEGNLLKLRASSSGASIGPGGTPISPLQAQVGSTWPTCNWSDYNMGIRFTANTNGSITQLGMRVDNTESRTVRLYDFTSGTVLASATVSGVNTSTWVYVNITPVAITSGTSYIVSERGSTYCGINTTLPFTQSNITVLDGRYIGNSDSMPNSFAADYVYGLADVTFVPQGLISDGGSGSKLNLGAAGSQTIQYVDVKDNNAKWGQTLDATTGGVNSGNNTNWTFSFSSPTSTTLTSSSNPSAHNAAVTFTATVTGSSPTGTVTFKDGATTIGTATLGQGSGTLVTSALTPGYHSITAEYGGDGSNGTSTSAAVNQFVAMTTSSADWAYRKKITVANTNVTADLTDFPLLVKFSGDANIAAGTQSTGNDIRFTTSSGVLLPYEREDYHETSSSGAGLFWVKVPKIKANGTGNGSGATIYLYYGSGSAVDGQNIRNVWDSNFKGVWHLSGATLHGTDSTANGNNSNALNAASAVSGQVDGAANINGATYINVPTHASLNPGAQMTASAWVYPSNATGVQEYLIKYTSAPSYYYLRQNGGIFQFTPSSTSTEIGSVSYTPAVFPTNQWTLVTGTFDGSVSRIYTNGIQRNSTNWTGSVDSNAGAFTIGALGSASTQYYTGRIDETRLSSVARSAAWVKFEYYNMGGSSNNDLTFGAQDNGLPSTTTALTSSQNPSAHNAAVTFTATVTGTSPTGTVTFKDGVTTIGTATLGQGSGTLVTSALTPGYHSITAEYGGDGSNGTSTSTAVSQFVAMATSDADWVYRKKITVANTNVTADLTDFPLLVKFSGDADIAAGTQSTGNDIRFATATGVLLPYEREDYHERSSSGAGLFWVKVPKIKANGTGNGSGATIYLYYGSGSAVDGQTRTSVWDTNFKGVWHLSGATLHATDSTSNGNNGTNNAVTATAGQVDGGGNFNGSSNVDMGTKLPDLLSSLTISTWVKPGATQVAYADIWGNHQDNSRGLVLQQNNTTTNQFGFGYGDATTFKGLAGSYSLSANVWQYVVIVKDPSLCYMYVNGVEQTALRGACTTDVAPATTMNFNLGRGYAGGGRYFNGQLDEARVSASARSASWIKFEYYNMGGSANNDLSLGSEESTNSTTTTLTSSLNPSLPGQSVTLTATVSPSFVTGTITFKDGATTLGTVTLGQGSGSITKSDFTIGRHSLTAVYGGGDGYLTSTSSILVQSVNVSLTGKAYQNDGVTPLTATSVTVASGSAILDSAITDNGGQFTLSGGLALGTVATVFVSGAATKAVTVTVSSGATMTGVNLIGSTLVMRHETGGLLTNSHLVTAKASGNADITAVFNMTGGSLVLAAGKSLLVAPRTTFVPGGRISTSDLTVNGTLTMGTYGLTATGSFITSSGSFSTGTGVTLKPQTLTGNMLTLGAGQSFQNLTLQGPPTIMTATLQPSTDAVDTFLYNPAPTTSYGQSTLFQIGNESFAGNAFRAALGFDLSTIPASATIDNVAMQMYNYSCIDNASGCGTAYTLGLYQLTRTLTEAATWNTYNGTNAWTTAGGDYTTLLGQTSFPGTAVNAGHGWVTMGDQSAAFTSYVQSVVGTGRANLLVKYNTYSYWVGRYYYSSEYADATYHPKLVVTYRSGSDGQKVTLGSGVTINGNFTILNGGLDVSATGNYPIALAGNFINKMGTGALLARRGTVTLTGGSQTLSGSTIFNNLTKNVTSAATLTFDHAGTQTVSGALLLSGAAENLLSLRSTVSAVGARLKLLGSTQSLSYLDVKDNDASGGQTLLCSSKNSGCVSNGNTLNWNFGWYRNWPYRKKIIVANTNVDADLTSFPLLVRFSGDANISARAKSDGSDLRFADVDGNILPYEKEDYHVRSSSGAGLFWVKVPTIKENGTGNGSGATIYLYYGSGSAADGQDVRNVWDTDFKGVWHLSGAVLSVRDSTSNANVGTNNGATATLGMVDGAGKFELVRSTHVSIADATPLNPDQKTLSMWVNVPEYASSNYQHAGKITLGTNGYMLYSESANHKFYFFNYGNTPTNVADTTVYSLNTWYYVTGVYDGSNLRIYRNGIQTNSVSVTGTTSNSNQPFQLGLYASNGQYTNQTADEVRLSSVARTAPWIKFEYYNMGGSSNNDLTFDTEDSLEESATSPQKKSTFWFIDW